MATTPLFSQIVGTIAVGAVSQNTATITLTKNATQGSIVFIVAKSGSGLTLSSVADTQSNTWSTPVNSASASSINCGMSWAYLNNQLTVAATDTITATFSGAVTNLAAAAYQYTGGYTPFTQGVTGSNAAPTTASLALSGNITPQASTSLFVTGLAVGSATITAINAPTNFTQQGATVQAGSSTVVLADARLGSTAAFNPSWSWTTSSNAGIVVLELLASTFFPGDTGANYSSPRHIQVGDGMGRSEVAN